MIKHNIASLIGEWPSGLMFTLKIERIPILTSLGTQLGFVTQPCYEAPGDLRVEPGIKRSD